MCKDLLTQMWAGCARCGKAPPCLDPLTEGWVWDTDEPDNPWLWCPHWHLTNGCADAAQGEVNHDNQD